MSDKWTVHFADGTLDESATASGLLHAIASQHWSYDKNLTDKENILSRLHEQTGGWISPEIEDTEFLLLLSEANLLQVKTPQV